MKTKQFFRMMLALTIAVFTMVQCKKDDPSIEVTDLVLDKEQITLVEGASQTLAVTVIPKEATEKAVTWSSDNEAVATVDAKGKVTAVKAGKATITVKTKDGGKTATCVVTVKAISGTYPKDQKILVKGGTFDMGSNNANEREKPVHRVTVSDFYIGKYEVTNAQYAKFLNAKGNQEEGGKTWLNIGSKYCQIEKVGDTFKAKAGKENYPVIMVTWYGAKAFAEWVGGRLPTEAEWEYAARGGNKSKGYKYSGSNNIDDVAWYWDNSENSENDMYKGKGTHPIGKKKANELGIYDMSGNVWEWCSDRYGSYSSAAQTNPQGATSGSDRVLRGGSWCGSASNCRVASRNDGTPFNSGYDVGFRVVFLP